MRLGWLGLLLIFASLCRAFDPYEVLGLDQDAEQADIRRAYRRFSRKYHPDKIGKSADGKLKLQQVNDAFEMLGDADKRVVFDHYGEEKFTERWQFEQAQTAKGGSTQGGASFYRDHDLILSVTRQAKFNKALRSNKAVLAEYYAPWCVHCQEMMGAFKKTAVLLEDEDVQLVAVNCDEAQRMCNSHRAHSYPTVLLHIDSEGIVEHFDGEKTADNLVAWVSAFLHHRVKALAHHNFRETVVESEDVWLVLFSAGSWCGPCTQVDSAVKRQSNSMSGASVGRIACDEGPNQVLCQEHEIDSYPAMKIFGADTPHNGGQGVFLEQPHQWEMPQVSAMKIFAQAMQAAKPISRGGDDEDDDDDGWGTDSHLDRNEL